MINGETLEDIKKELSNKIDYNEIGKWICKKYHLFYDKSGSFYIWDSEKKEYNEIDKIDILNLVKDSCNISNICQPSINVQIMNSLMMEGRELKPTELDDNYIQFGNKIINIKTEEELEASPEYLCSNPIKWELGESEDTPTINKIMMDWFGNEDIVKRYQEWVAYQLYRGYPIQKLCFQYSKGGNGKTSAMNFITKFLGEENITAGNYEIVFINRFGTNLLYKKLSMFMPETDFGTIKQTSTLKNATGDDHLIVEFKGKNGFAYKNYCKLTISANSVPSVLDKTNSFYRRLLLFKFEGEFAGATGELNIINKIPEIEFKNFAKKSIRLLRELLERKEFYNDKELEEIKEEYERVSNPIDTFIKEETENNPNGFISKREFKSKLNEWLAKNGFRVYTSQELGKSMEQNHEFASKPTGEKNGTICWERCWLGIDWKETKRDELNITTEKVR